MRTACPRGASHEGAGAKPGAVRAKRAVRRASAAVPATQRLPERRAAQCTGLQQTGTATAACPSHLRTMYVFYLDESGSTGLDLSSTVETVHWPVVLGAAAHDVHSIERDIRVLADSYFGLRAGAPAFELHGAEIFGGRGVARTLAPARRVSLFAGVLGLLDTHDVHLWVRGIHKARLRERSRAQREDPEHPSILAFRDIVTSLDTWLQARQPAPGTPCAGATDQLGLLVSDQQDEVSRSLAAEFAHLRDTGIRSLIDTIHYVRSRDSRLIQLVDCVAFIRNRYEKNLTKCGGDEARFGQSETAVATLWKEHCLPRVVDSRVWPG